MTRDPLVDDRLFDKGGPLYDRLREAGGSGPATCPARDHRRQRRLIQPAFHRARLPGYADTMTEVIDAATSGWRAGGRVDPVSETRSMAAAILLSTVFGTALPAASGNARSSSRPPTATGARSPSPRPSSSNGCGS
ncbi:hypothetical protein ABZ318_11480 [Streptomyces sp. NPDC006197]|uniref:hypothetical protein n=1 Tax=Streptomyces sp. NPDC006197 TaxID=3156685 RepID=UPI0033B69988